MKHVDNVKLLKQPKTSCNTWCSSLRKSVECEGQRRRKEGGGERREEVVEHLGCGGTGNSSITVPQFHHLLSHFLSSVLLQTSLLVLFWPSVLQKKIEMFLFTFILEKKNHFRSGQERQGPSPFLRWSPSCSFCSLLFKTFQFLPLTTILFFLSMFWLSSGQMEIVQFDNIFVLLFLNAHIY